MHIFSLIFTKLGQNVMDLVDRKDKHKLDQIKRQKCRLKKNMRAILNRNNYLRIKTLEGAAALQAKNTTTCKVQQLMAGQNKVKITNSKLSKEPPKGIKNMGCF